MHTIGKTPRIMKQGWPHPDHTGGAALRLSPRFAGADECQRIGCLSSPVSARHLTYFKYRYRFLCADVGSQRGGFQ